VGVGFGRRARLDAHGTGQHAVMTAAGLTSREREVLRLIAAGRSTASYAVIGLGITAVSPMTLS
jgi:DNA-binding CsgD family transcriptional regulator